MIVERNEFRLKFGASTVARNLWMDYLNVVRQEDPDIHVRILTDISGPAYTLIVELIHETFVEAEPTRCRLVQRNDWKDFYNRFIPLCESSHRTYYKQQLEI